VKWHNHKIVTASIVWIATNNLLAVVPATIGSIIPDFIEGKWNEGINTSHRKISHWWIPYFLIFVVCSFSVKGVDINYHNFLHFAQINLKITLIFLCQYLALGALFHIIEDTLCGKVPLLNPYRKEFGFRIFRVGSIGEYIFVGLFLLSILFIKKMQL